VRILISAGSVRMTALPEVPTLAQTLPNGPVVTSGSSVIGPGGLAAPVVDRIASAFSEVMTRDQDLRDRIAGEGGSIVLSGPVAYRADWPREFKRLQDLVELSGVRNP
jgi:tripartite-type tricarboxylate transporter receptor subunit TctC